MFRFIILSCVITILVGVFYLFKVVGSKPSISGVNEASKVLGLTSALGPVDESPAEDSDKIVIKIGGTKAIFSKKKDLKSQVTALQALVKQIRMDGKSIEVDLRFNKPVVRIL